MSPSLLVLVCCNFFFGFCPLRLPKKRGAVVLCCIFPFLCFVFSVFLLLVELKLNEDFLTCSVFLSFFFRALLLFSNNASLHYLALHLSAWVFLLCIVLKVSHCNAIALVALSLVADHSLLCIKIEF